MNTLRRVVVSSESGLDAITMLGALSSQGGALGLVLPVLGGRSLPVTVRELTTLEHLTDGDLVVVLDPQGCTVNQVEEALALIDSMAVNEVTSTSGPTWVLEEAPNRPLPTRGAFKLFVLDEGHGALPLGDIAGVGRVALGQSGIVGEVWEYSSPDELAALVGRTRHSSAS